jgi:hypothetical protein
MPEKLTLTRYLQGRGEVKALTHIEALAFGVPYPLQPGWPAKYGAMEITEGMIEDLKARILTAKESTASKARRGLEGIGDAVLAPATAVAQSLDDQHPPTTRGPAPSSIRRLALFHGFTLRQARRYRARKLAPWA